MNEREFHEAANIFPLDEDHLDDLAADIREHGLQVVIETLDDKILDGRRRYLACQKAGVEPKYRAVQTPDPVAYVISLNLHRRHLTPSQLSMCAARARDLYDQQAKERQKEAGKIHGRGKEKLVANLPQANSDDTGKARDQVGEVFGVSGRSVEYATKVLKEAAPEVVKAVDEGRMAVSTAAILASEPEEVQRKEVQFDARGRKRSRKYTSGPNGAGDSEPQNPEEEESNGEIKIVGVGVIRGHEAINCLNRIPKNDALRKRGFQLVTDWIRRNR